ncbi:hypothetical protein Cni_G22929 [Canna indica]|uniref:SOSEKI DIX-like domain-containing protein n=1 Tax=Canna indica TaxID=4628 RepID=A0AAQ3KT76_9LILI|nr:hypothetical protein Cni_G22929 [Canna indica]
METSNDYRGGGGGGGEVRRVNVVYFLSRDGRVEHPHLLRIHRLRQDRVCLRDVKRWLSKARGKEMPEFFSWSYKRRYRGGYIWQDLLDDDLITPFSDDEYVLKGSEIISISSEDEKTPEATTSAGEDEGAGAETLPISPREDEQVSPKPPPGQIDEDSSGTLDVERASKEMKSIVLVQREEEESGDEDDDVFGSVNSTTNGSKKKPNRTAKLVLLSILGCKSADALHPVTTRSPRGKAPPPSGCGRVDDTNRR